MEQNTQNLSKDSLKVTALTQRIAAVVAQYEEELADLRAEATVQIHDLQNQIIALSASLEEKRNEVSAKAEEQE